MRKVVSIVVAVMAIALPACSSSPPSASPTSTTGVTASRRTVTITDDVDRKVTLEVPLRRVAIFNAFNGEYIRAVGAMDSIVGMDASATGPNYAGYWPGFDTSSIVGKGQSDPNYERIVEAKPEAVIFPENGAWQAAETKLEPLGIKVIVMTGWDQNKAKSDIRLAGELFGKEARAKQLVEFYDKNYSLLKDRLKDVPAKPVYLENDKNYASPIPGSGWHQMITLGGGRNIFGDISFNDKATKGSVHQYDIDPEQILQRQPALVIRNTGGGYAQDSMGDLGAQGTSLLERPGWKALPATRDHKVWVTSSWPMNAFGKVIGSMYVAKWLHPDAMRDVDPDAVMREWIHDYQGVEVGSFDAYHRQVA